VRTSVKIGEYGVPSRGAGWDDLSFSAGGKGDAELPCLVEVLSGGDLSGVLMEGEGGVW